MIKLSLAVVLAAVAVAAPAVASPKTSFTHEGVTYTYTSVKVGETTILRGTAMPGDRFQFSVSNGRVVGKMNGQMVRFSVADALERKGSVSLELASR